MESEQRNDLITLNQITFGTDCQIASYPNTTDYMWEKVFALLQLRAAIQSSYTN